MCNNSGGFYITHGSRKAKAKAIVNLRFRGIIRPNRRKSERLKRISSVVISRATMNCHRDSWKEYNNISQILFSGVDIGSL